MTPGQAYDSAWAADFAAARLADNMTGLNNRFLRLTSTQLAAGYGCFPKFWNGQYFWESGNHGIGATGNDSGADRVLLMGCFR